MTAGTSAIPDILIASCISANPPPDVDVIALAPAYHPPSTMFAAAISSSACSTTIPNSFDHSADSITISVPGDIGYAVTKFIPPATIPYATASFPVKCFFGMPLFNST